MNLCRCSPTWYRVHRLDIGSFIQVPLLLSLHEIALAYVNAVWLHIIMAYNPRAESAKYTIYVIFSYWGRGWGSFDFFGCCIGVIQRFQHVPSDHDDNIARPNIYTYEPRHENIWFYCLRRTQKQNSLRIRSVRSAPLLYAFRKVYYM